MASNFWDMDMDDYVPSPVAAHRKCPEHSLGIRGDGVSFVRACTSVGPHEDHAWGPWQEIVPVPGDPAFCEIKEPETRQ